MQESRSVQRRKAAQHEGPAPDFSTADKDFKHGDKVRYVPNHADGDVHHVDCQDGVVSSTNEKFVFVKYDNAMRTMTTGDEPYTAQATKRENLVRRT